MITAYICVLGIPVDRECCWGQQLHVCPRIGEEFLFDLDDYDEFVVAKVTNVQWDFTPDVDCEVEITAEFIGPLSGETS